MSCQYCDFRTGECQCYDEGVDNPGCDENGICICQDDEDPSYLCENYEEC